MGEKTALCQNFISPNYSEMRLEATMTSYRDYDVNICKDVSYSMWFSDFVSKSKNICMKFKGVIFLDNGPFTLCLAIMLKKSWNE